MTMDTGQIPTVSLRNDAERDGRLVEATRAGDQSAFGQLYDLWFDRVYDVAFRIVRDRHGAADVAQEAFLSAWRKLGDLDQPNAFGGWLLRIGRNGALNRLSKEKRATPMDGEGMSVVEATEARPGGPAGFSVEDRALATDDPASAAADADLAALLWESAAVLGDRDAMILDLHLRHDLGPAEIGEELGITRNNANQLLFRLKGKLGGAIRARVLWRGGRPSCAGLAQALELGGITSFDDEAVRIVTAHASVCEECAERQKSRLEPAALFGAIPIMAAPLVLKANAAAALTASGVPMGGSTATAAAGAAGPGPGAGGSGGSGSGGPGDPGGASGGSGQAVKAGRKSMSTGGKVAVGAAAAGVAVVVAVVAFFLTRPPPATKSLSATVTTVAGRPSTTFGSPPTGALQSPAAQGGSGGAAGSGGQSSQASAASSGGMAITSFSVSPTSPNCVEASTRSLSVSWSTAHATKAVLSIDGPGAYATYGPSGSTTVNFPCDGHTHTYMLTAYGTGGAKVTSTRSASPSKGATSTTTTTKPTKTTTTTKPTRTIPTRTTPATTKPIVIN